MNTTKIVRDLKISLNSLPNTTFTIQSNSNNEIDVTWSKGVSEVFVEEYLASIGYPAYLASTGIVIKMIRKN
jgi:hypothetical protein